MKHSRPLPFRLCALGQGQRKVVFLILIFVLRSDLFVGVRRRNYGVLGRSVRVLAHYNSHPVQYGIGILAVLRPPISTSAARRADTLTLPLAHFHLPMQTFPDVPRPRFGNSVAMVNGATNKSYQFTIAQIHLFELHACIRSRGSDCRDVEHDIFGHVRSWVWRLRKLWALNWRNASPRTNPKPD